MEFGKSPDDTKEESPSQENIFHPQSMKRDVESLEDFEDITKDEPSMKDVTAQFLQFETGGINKPKSDESVYSQYESDHKSNDDLLSFLPTQSSATVVNDMSKDFGDDNWTWNKEPSSKTAKEEHDEDLLGFEQTESQPKKFDNDTSDYSHNEKPTEKPIVNILDENKLIDVLSNDEISTGSDDLSFIPKKGESSPLLYSDLEKDIPKKPLSECKSNEKTESPFNTQPLSKFTSEPGVNMEQEPVPLQGDGLHVRENFEADGSDNDDFVPEPIPKDYPEIGALEGKQFLAALGLGAWIQPFMQNPKFESLVYWRDPKKSGIVFGSILIVLLSLTTFSLISVIAYTSLIALSAALAFRIYKNVLQAVQKTSEGHPFKKILEVLNHPIVSTVFLTIKEYLEVDLTVNPDKAREIADVAVSHINKALTEFRRLFLVEDVIDSIKFGLILWGLTYVGSWFNGLSLLIIAFVGLFTLPKVYENNKTQIDANIDIVKTKINEVTEKITAVIPLGKKTEEVKDKGE